MTAEAHVGLAALREDGIAVLVNAVAIGARDAAALVRATDGWSAGAWHCWHSSGGVLISSALRSDPCAVWQSEQSSATGACSHSSGPRLSAWQLKQVWFSVGLFSIAVVVEPCGLWQSLQLISPKRTGWVDGF